jgi:hypothetical protein
VHSDNRSFLGNSRHVLKFRRRVGLDWSHDVQIGAYHGPCLLLTDHIHPKRHKQSQPNFCSFWWLKSCSDVTAMYSCVPAGMFAVFETWHRSHLSPISPSCNTKKPHTTAGNKQAQKRMGRGILPRPLESVHSPQGWYRYRYWYSSSLPQGSQMARRTTRWLLTCSALGLRENCD